MSSDLFAARVEGALRREEERQPQPPLTGVPTGVPPTAPRALGRKMVYVLALEADPPDPNWDWEQRALDSLVQAFQPSPVLTHVELLIPPDEDPNPMSSAEQYTHFATYLGKESGWGTSFDKSKQFYTRGRDAESWRALPIVAMDATTRLRAECEVHKGTPYGKLLKWKIIPRLFDYPFSVPPLRSLAWTLSDEPLSDAHCATLTARCLRRALPQLELPHPSAWFGPSTLWIELARRSRMEAYQRQLADTPLCSIVEEEAARACAEEGMKGLQTMKNEELRSLSHEQCHAGTEYMARKVIEAAVEGDATKERLWQKALAKALLRWTQERNIADKDDDHTRVAAGAYRRS